MNESVKVEIPLRVELADVARAAKTSADAGESFTPSDVLRAVENRCRAGGIYRLGIAELGELAEVMDGTAG